MRRQDPHTHTHTHIHTKNFSINLVIKLGQIFTHRQLLLTHFVLQPIHVLVCPTLPKICKIGLQSNTLHTQIAHIEHEVQNHSIHKPNLQCLLLDEALEPLQGPHLRASLAMHYVWRSIIIYHIQIQCKVKLEVVVGFTQV